jgi:antitoxin ParD1/3/4
VAFDSIIVSMERMNISLPENLKGFIDSRVKAGGYSSVSEYVRDLVREDQKRQARENLEALLLEATRSGAGGEFTKADWEALRRELSKRFR